MMHETLASGSAAFEDFMRLLGDRISLKGWEKYTGGLSPKGESFYTEFQGNEVPSI